MRARYDDDATFQAHLAAKPVADGLFAWSTSVPNLWARSPTVQNFTVLDDLNFVKPEFTKVADPYMAVEAVSYSNGTVGEALKFWKDVVATSRAESGTLAFGVYGDPTDPNKLWALAAYESVEYRSNVHAQSAAAKALDGGTKDWRTIAQRNLLQKRGGFLYKGSPCG